MAKEWRRLMKSCIGIPYSSTNTSTIATKALSLNTVICSVNLKLKAKAIPYHTTPVCYLELKKVFILYNGYKLEFWVPGVCVFDMASSLTLCSLCSGKDVVCHFALRVI